VIAVANSVVQGVLIAVAAVIFAAVVTVVFRRSLVSFRYWFGWLAVASVLLAAGVVLAVIPDDVHLIGFSQIQIGAVLFLLVNLLIAVQLSISISGHQRQITELAQESAELRRRVEVLEGALTPDPGNP
jgi:drug/metabolite transporter (DMT)-like permease